MTQHGTLEKKIIENAINAEVFFCHNVSFVFFLCDEGFASRRFLHSCVRPRWDDAEAELLKGHGAMVGNGVF